MCALHLDGAPEQAALARNHRVEIIISR